MVGLLVVAALAAPVPRCHTAGLAASLAPGSPGAGQRYALLSLRNIGPRRCRVFGYAGLQLLDSRGRPLPTAVARDRSRAPRPIVLTPGSRTRALLHWAGIPVGDEPQRGPCEPTPRRVEVTPPDEVAHKVLRWRFGPVCGHGRIDLTPFGRTVL
jgi:hypothetical protein